MRVLLYSPAFLPQVGGLEIHVATLAAELAAAGQEVAVVTRTPGTDGEDSYRVVRRPGPRELLRWTRWCDVFFQANVSLRGLWPLLVVRRPWVVSHHSWYRRGDGRIAWRDRLKRVLLRRASASIAVSRAVAADLATPSTVIPNAYRDGLFHVLPDVERGRDLVAVGRLVSDKGIDLLLDALALLARQGVRPGLTVAGDGPERPRLEERAARLRIGGQVDFRGTVTGQALVRLLNAHRVLVVPSRYDEPFGIVALEGIACGCAVVGSAGGGLGEAIGPCGRTFPNGDVPALARALAELLHDPRARAACLDPAAEHLARHGSARVAERYLETLAAAVRRRPRGRAEVARSGAR
ncbi:MAG TPA: glycosyltransferase family 4 protein [Thermoanaerobaculia bacterium]|nr:glycosyltransferase family 4 protein [Thermoanaerobaculia bacterium]